MATDATRTSRSIKVSELAYYRLKVEAARRGVKMIDLLEHLTDSLPEVPRRPNLDRKRRRPA